MAGWLIVLLTLGAPPGPATAGASTSVAAATRAEVAAEWARDDQARTRGVNPSGEVQGATTKEDAAGGVDGVKDGQYGFHTTYSLNPWWQVDLGAPVELDHLVVYNRCGPGLRERSSGMMILVSLDGETWAKVFQHSGPAFGGVPDGKPLQVDLRGKQVVARWVRCQVPKQVSFHLDEVEVYGAADPQKNIALNKPADQSSAGRSSRPHAAAGAPPADTYPPARTAEAIARARKLLGELERLGLDGKQRDERAAELDRVGRGDRPVAPTPEPIPASGPKPKSIGSFIAGFKSTVTKQINELRGTPGAKLWQRNYYEHVIRDEDDLNRIRQYILDNPARWDKDENNPDRFGRLVGVEIKHAGPWSLQGRIGD
jgi:hypothetical protein